MEAALSHLVQNKVEAAYGRSDLFERRWQLLEDWAVFMDDQRFSGQAMQPCSGTGAERTADHERRADRRTSVRYGVDGARPTRRLPLFVSN